MISLWRIRWCKEIGFAQQFLGGTPGSSGWMPATTLALSQQPRSLQQPLTLGADKLAQLLAEEGRTGQTYADRALVACWPLTDGRALVLHANLGDQKVPWHAVQSADARVIYATPDAIAWPRARPVCTAFASALLQSSVILSSGAAAGALGFVWRYT